jgi:hypothetical protein
MTTPENLHFVSRVYTDTGRQLNDDNEFGTAWDQK